MPICVPRCFVSIASEHKTCFCTCPGLLLILLGNLKHFKNYRYINIKNQGITFPEMQDPQKIVYYFKGKTEIAFNQTIALLQGFKYSRYTPILYYVGNKGVSEFEKQQTT